MIYLGFNRVEPLSFSKKEILLLGFLILNKELEYLRRFYKKPASKSKIVKQLCCVSQLKSKILDLLIQEFSDMHGIVDGSIFTIDNLEQITGFIDALELDKEYNSQYVELKQLGVRIRRWMGRDTGSPERALG